MQLWSNYLDQILLYALLALSLNVLLGYAGQVSVAHVAFAAMGGYAMGYTVMKHEWNFMLGILVGMAVALIGGFLLALPAMRLSVEYLILLTLAASSVIIGFLITVDSLGGSYGLIGIPKPDLFGFHFRRPADFLLLLIPSVVVMYLICWRIGESPYGRVLKALREDPIATQSLGKNVFRYKLVVFGITASLAGYAGGLYSSWIALATPNVFGFAFSLTIFAIVILGGMANLTGSVVASFIVLLDPLLRNWVKMDAADAALVQLILYGVLLVVFMRLRPQGILPEGFSLWRKIARRRQPIGRIEMPASEGWVPSTEAKISESDTEAARERRWHDAEPVLVARGITKRFGGITAAEDLDFELRKGTITALVGPNGAGKTTVFNLITGFIKPDRGSVELRGRELVGRNPDAIARLGMARSFQDVKMFQRLTCLQNVSLGVQHQPGEKLPALFIGGGKPRRGEAQTREKAMEWLSFVGMREFADVPTGALSYGQTKLISLARVLATEAEVLLLDEPASGIDTRWVDTMLDLIETVREQGRTVCIVEHNLHVVGRLADHIYFMELGRITAEGTMEELTSVDRLAEAYFGTAAA
jgi:branched-chain amino acid transport system permease protein